MRQRSKRVRAVLDAESPNHTRAQAVSDCSLQRIASDDTADRPGDSSAVKALTMARVHRYRGVNGVHALLADVVTGDPVPATRAHLRETHCATATLDDQFVAVDDQRPARRTIGRRSSLDEVYVAMRDGVRLAVRDSGSRYADHTVVFLHGFCLSQASWERQVDHLLQRYGPAVRVISYDHRGHGRSGQAPMSSYRIEQLADDLAQVLTVRRVTGPLTLAGHSMGGMTALRYLARPAADRPVEPHGLVLVASAAGKLGERGLGRLLATPATGALFGLIDHTPARALRALAGPLCSTLRRWCIGGSAERATLAAVTAAALASTPVPTAAGFLPSLRSYDQYHTLGAIRANTIVVSGGADKFTPPAHARDLVAGIPGATLVYEPGAGHMLLDEAPRLVTEAISCAIALSGASPATFCTTTAVSAAGTLTR